MPQPWLVGIQLYRALGVIFLILYASGRLPGLFAWPAGVGDILVGVLAPVVALAYARAPRENGDLVAAWNVFGILDLAVAVGTGFATSPSQFQLFALDRPNELVTAFPLVLVPTYLRAVVDPAAPRLAGQATQEASGRCAGRGAAARELGLKSRISDLRALPDARQKRLMQ